MRKGGAKEGRKKKGEKGRLKRRDVEYGRRGGESDSGWLYRLNVLGEASELAHVYGTGNEESEMNAEY